MRAFLMIAAIVITASAQAKTISVQCKTGAEEEYKHSIALSFDDSTPGPAKSVQSLIIDGRDAMEPGREKGQGIMVSGEGKLDIKVDVSLYPQYVPYNKSTFELSVGACETRSGAGFGKYFQQEYRMPARTFDLTCACGSSN